MPIIVGHDDPAAEVGFAYQAGQAMAQRENLAQSAAMQSRANMQSQFLASQHVRDLRNMAYDDYRYDRQRRDVLQDRMAERAFFDFREQQQHERQLELERQRQKFQQENFDYELSAQQKQRVSRINDFLSIVDDAVARGDVDPQQAAHMRMQAHAEINGLNPQLVPRKKQPPLADQIKAETVPDEIYGGWWVRRPDGGIDYQMPPARSDATERAKAEAQAAKDEAEVKRQERKFEFDLRSKAVDLMLEHNKLASAGVIPGMTTMTFDEAYGYLTGAAPKQPAAEQEQIIRQLSIKLGIPAEKIRIINGQVYVDE